MTYIRVSLAAIRYGLLSVVAILAINCWQANGEFLRNILPNQATKIDFAIVFLAFAVPAFLNRLYVKRCSVQIRSFAENMVTCFDGDVRRWLDAAMPRQIAIGIVVLSGLSLFLELALIRWQGSLFPVFGLYKNFTLLACFCGLGIGYALAQREKLVMPFALPMLFITLLILSVLRYCSGDFGSELMFFVPIHEEGSVANFNMATVQNQLIISVFIYSLLAATFLLNVLLMLPITQLCGCFMDRVKPLTGYGSNLLGSIVGVLLLFGLSSLWIGPVIWFLIAAAALFVFVLPVPMARSVAMASLVLCVMVTAWPFETYVQNIYSPYQLIQKVATTQGYMGVLSGGSYYQRILNLSDEAQKYTKDKNLSRFAGYYELPFRAAASLDNVVIVGAGTGNDVAAALRSNAKAVTAVEIDPVIRNLGYLNHPEHPYSSELVKTEINDARTFFRNATDNYDAIVYGVLDSHILLSHGSNVRVDSFVYTQEGLREAYNHLKDGGLMSVAFALTNNLMGEKVYKMLSALPEAGKVKAVRTAYDNVLTTSFLVAKKAEVQLPRPFMAAHQLEEVTEKFSAPSSKALDLPSDDWPFFYMNIKTYPASYVVSLLLILALAVAIVRVFLPGQKWDDALLPFFFLGGGFMLVETKAITELGLIFGNTWYVVGITIICVLVMAFFANLLVSRVNVKTVVPAYGALLAVVGLGYVVAMHGGVGQGGGFAAKVAMAALLTCPLLFSGIIFSTLLKRANDVPGAMAYNLMGAMLGGLLEYNAMQFGFASLYLIGLALYGAAWLCSGRKRITLN